nr:VWA domain-containing protein [Nocardia transvalensis]
MAVPALADEGGGGVQYAPTMVILDASGSMERPDSGGTMMDSAKRATRSFVSAAPDAAKVGLMTYGTSTGNAPEEKAAGCRDVSLLRRPDTLDKGALTAAVDGITARGWTPMGVALKQAAEALPTSGPRSIVLVSDGDDTCAPPDPCDVARELKKQGVDLIVHSIGFAVEANARAQLTCMAQATGGTYTDAPDGRSLEQILPRVSGAALRNYQTAGKPITGTDKYRTAPKATPGQYLDTIGQKETRYYAVDVPDGATAYFSGTMSFPRKSGISVTDDLNTLTLRVYGTDGRDCNVFEHEMVTKSSDGVALTVAKAWDGATKKKDGKTAADSCKGGGPYYFALEWDHVSTGVPERLPIELLVGLEPAVTDPGPAAVLPVTAFTPPTGPDVPTAGGGSFNVATELPGSGSYTDTLQRGEFVFYRVRLKWGQGLSYRVHFESNGHTGIDNMSNVQTVFYTPLRERIDSDFASYTGSENVLPNQFKSLATVPIRYGNRNADAYELRRQSVEGWYYIAVKAGATSSEGPNVPVPVRVEVTVAGQPEAGPKYVSAEDGGIFGEQRAGGTGGGTGETGGSVEPAVAAEASGSSKGWIVAAAGAGVVVVLLALVGGFVLGRRRRG